jgi:hypothetical protein
MHMGSVSLSRNGIFAVLRIAIFGLAIAVMGCSGGGGGGAASGANNDNPGSGTTEVSLFDQSVLQSLPLATPASYKAGTPVMVSQATIGAKGGILTGAAGTPVEGVVVTVPEGALTESTTLSLGYDNGVFTNVKPEEQGIVMVLQSSGRTDFPKPLQVEFPFKRAGQIPVPYYINDNGRFEIVTALPFDRTTGRAGFITWHVSKYTYTFANEDPSAPKPVSIGFDVSRDGFEESNVYKSKYVVLGSCWGMSNFVKWYWNEVGAGLYRRFFEGVRSALNEDMLSGQRLISIRAHNSVAYYTAENASKIQEPKTFSDFVVQVKDALSKGSSPVMISLEQGGGGALHAVLAVGYSDNQIAVYDPSWPGTTRAINYKTVPRYGDIWKKFGIFGNGELRLNEKYLRLLSDATEKFHGENETKIEVTSHQPDQKVDKEDISLEGKVHSGQVLISELEAHVNYEDGTSSETVKLPMPPDDNTFKLPLKLKQGWNGVVFRTRGYIAYSSDKIMVIPNDPKAFSLERVKDAPKPNSSITVTSTRTDKQPGYRIEVTTSYSAKLIYDTYGAEKVFNPAFDYNRWCSVIDSNCRVLRAESYDSLDFLKKNRIPVTVKYHFKEYEIDSDGKETLMQYTDGEGTLTCNSVQLGIHVEPGSTATNRKYRLVVKAGDICFPGDPAPMVTGKYKFWPSDPDWHDLIPEPLSLYSVSPYSVQNDREDLLPCEKPPQILSANIDPWIMDQTTQKTWVLKGSIQGCDDNGMTRTEDATVNLTLVP